LTLKRKTLEKWFQNPTKILKLFNWIVCSVIHRRQQHSMQLMLRQVHTHSLNNVMRMILYLPMYKYMYIWEHINTSVFWLNILSQTYLVVMTYLSQFHMFRWYEFYFFLPLHFKQLLGLGAKKNSFEDMFISTANCFWPTNKNGLTQNYNGGSNSIVMRYKNQWLLNIF
jgi:hypothetical protein